MKDISEKDFEQEEFLDEDFAEVDALIEFLQKLPRREVHVINLPRVKQFRFAGAMIKKVLRETGCSAKVVCKHHEHNPTAGVIRIEGKTIDILDIEGYSMVGEFASNVEAFPLTNGNVRMAYMFYGLMVPPDKVPENFGL